MSIDHNRIKVADLEQNQPNKILTTDQNGKLEFTDINNIKTDNYNALDYTTEGKALDARQGKILKDLIDNINTLLTSDNVNLNTLQELVDAIETIQNSLNTILVNDLTSGGTNKALTAEMGKLLQNNKIDKVTGERLINAVEINKLSGLSNVITTVKSIPSTVLATQNVAGFVNYINALNPVLIVGANEIIKYTTTDTGRTFELNLRGRSFGLGQLAITTNNVIEVTEFLNKDIKLSNYPSTRNDGQLSTNKVLSTDINGNLNMYSIATSPAPFLEEIIPDSYLPNTTGNFTIKGAFFTPNMTVSIVGQTINYITFISDNLIKVNVTTGQNDGSYAVTLNNGISATFNNALLIATGIIYTPKSTDFTVISGTVDLTYDGEVRKNTQNSDAIVEVYNINVNKNFQFRFQATPSPLLTNTYCDGFVYVDIIENGITRYSVKWWYAPNTIRFYQSSTGIYHPNNIAEAGFNFANNTIYYYQKIGSQMIVKSGSTVLATFTDLSNTGNIVFRIRNKCFDLKNIKYIELST